MKIQMRTSVFETNSSSTHSMTICTENDYKAFREGKKLIGKYSLKFYNSVEEGLANEKWAKKEDFLTYDEFEEFVSEYYEDFEEKFTTPSGEKVIAFGYYGYDG